MQKSHLPIVYMLKYHKWYDVVEVEDKEKEELLSKFYKVKNDLQSQRKYVLATKENVQMNSEICLAKLCSRKEELLRVITDKVDDLTKKVTKQTMKETSKLEEELCTINEVIELLERTKGNTELAESRQDIRRNVELVKNIEENAAQILKQNKFDSKNIGQKELKLFLKVVDRLCSEIDRFEHLVTTAINSAGNETRNLYKGTGISLY